MHSHLISIQTLSSPPSSHLYLFSFPRVHPPTSPISTQPSWSHHCPKNVAGVVMTGAGMAGLTYFANNEDDPYITLKDPVSWYHNISRHYPMPYWRFIARACGIQWTNPQLTKILISTI
jgi:hypothetical protein